MTRLSTAETPTRRPRIRLLAARPHAPVRLYCVPPAGMGAAAFYLPWIEHMPDDIELCAVEIPGQGPLADAPFRTDGERLGAEMAAAVLAQDDPRPFAVFGHSVGALLAYLTTRHLERAGAAPFLLGVSAFPAPHRADHAHLMVRTLSEGRRAICELFELPPELFDDEPARLVPIFTPILAAVVLALQYRHADHPPLPIAVATYGAHDDALTAPRHLAEWNDLVVTPAEPCLFPGAHMYVLPQAAALAERLIGDVRAAAGALRDREVRPL
ncbi:thioesterase II family protein [Actinomadura sp. 21ATH]|uniref:thioesterase II family protein n=1 Tax=Actinomadura sp. 21ATH TaxID=1735444 RepID=UPI0035C0C206